MAQNAPTAIDVQDIQFKLHDKFTIFPEARELKSLVSLLAVSSSKGLLFAGNPNAKELKVIKLRDVVDSKAIGQDLQVRSINLPGEPKSLACSCDGSMLAINYIVNNTGFLQVFQVDSFVTQKINSLYSVPISPENYVFALQLLWNPVIANNIALVLNDGSVTMFTLNPGGHYDKYSLGKEHQVRSGCWSPKGKQIVFGFAEGKLQQFKPNLQPARAIACPPGIHPGPFDCIAVHWLSTFQFAAVFLQRGADMCPTVFIVNAPKAGNTSYINYYDICYSAPGPRTQQLTFNYISQWNLLLVSSANGVEVGVLGTKESGENPTWCQYTLLDEARIEMPLTEAKDETYPIGFVYDTASTHHVKIGEQSLPVMPMIHVLSTHGHLVSFNFLNLSSTTVDVCSPPPPLNDTSGQFRSVKETIKPTTGGQMEKKQQSVQEPVAAAAAPPPLQAAAGHGDMTFTMAPNMVTSTPAIKDKPTPMFGSLTTGTARPSTGFGFGGTGSAVATSNANNNIKPSTGFGVSAAEPLAAASTAATSAATLGFGAQSMTTSFGGFGGGLSGFAAAKPLERKQALAQQSNTAAENTSRAPPPTTDVSKPLYTVPSTYKPPPSVMQTNKPVAVAAKINMNTGEIDEVVKQMIAIQMDAFEAEMKQIKLQSRKLMEHIGKPEEIKSYTKQLNDLQEIIEQANDYEFEQDVQSLRHSMNESYAMLAECRSKVDMYNNPNLTRLTTVASTDPTNRRQLVKLQSLATINQTQLSQLNLLLDAQWSQYQDVVRRNTKNHMHIPCLDGVYQRMSKLKDLLARQRSKLNHIKGKLKQKGMSYKPPSDVDVTTAAVSALTKNSSTMESLADSILSMSLSQVVSQTHAKLSEDKLNAIRNFTRQQHQITIIKPKRPDRVGLKSEVILETKLETERKQKELARQRQQMQMPEQKPNAAVMLLKQSMSQPTMQAPQISSKSSHPQHSMGMQKSQQQQPFLAKPTASKPPLLPKAAQAAAFITPTPASSTSSGLTFGSSSSFVKTSAAPSNVTAAKFDESSRPLAASTPFSAQQGVGFGQAKSVANQKVDSKENIPANTPISFSAKVIGGNDAKPMGTLSGNRPITSTGDGVGVAASQGFTSFSANKSSNIQESSSKDNTMPDQIPKTFSFGGISSNLPTSATSTSSATATPPIFGGFGAPTKSFASTAGPAVSSSTGGGGVFSSAMFGSSTATTAFAALSTTSTVPFGTSTNFSFNPGSNATTAGTTSTSSTAAASSNATATKAMEAKSAMTSEAATAVKSFQTAASKTGSSGNLEVDSTTTSNAGTATTKSSAPPNVVIGSKGIPAESKAADTTEPKSINAPTTTGPAADSSDSLLGSLNICKPDAKQAGDGAKSSANIFSGFGAPTSSAPATGPFAFATGSGSGDGAKSFLGFGLTTSTASNVVGKPDVVSTTATDTAVAGPAPTSLSAAVTASTVSTAATASTASTISTPTPTPAPPSTSPSSFSFGTTTASGPTVATGFGAMSLTATTNVTSTVATATATPASGNIFGGTTGSSVFGPSTASSTTATTGTTSIFGGTAAADSTGSSLLGSTAPASTAAATPTSGSIFGGGSAATPAAAAPSGANIFGGIPKPDQSVFGASTNTTAPAGTGLFAAAAAATKPPAAAGGGSIFGGGSMASGFGAPVGAAAGGSIFGGSSANATSPFGAPATAGPIFGSAASANPAEGGNIFGSPTQQSAASGGSIFGKSTFGQPAATSPQSGGSIFGGAAAQPTSAGGFGSSTGSIFGGGSAPNNPASGGSIFAAAAAATAPAFGASSASSGFGSFSQPSNVPAFGSPSSGGFGAPAGGAFSSPQQQSAFAKPVFGGPPAFGSPPAFGAQPTFGGAPTFGSPKGFGTFGSTSPAAGGFGAPVAAAPGAAAPKGNIFDTLGSTDSGLSFGNLAHNTQQPAQQKPAFGGSSFMSYRS